MSRGCGRGPTLGSGIRCFAALPVFGLQKLLLGLDPVFLGSTVLTAFLLPDEPCRFGDFMVI
jgi:hypothetical protein